MSNKQPNVFISYSWTSEEYKETVLQLAKKLVEYSVDVVLDVWDLRPGQDRFAFMEHSVENADKVLILCDEKYTEKANTREGGVGNETAIITPNIYGKYNQEKFIPVVMKSFECMPIYLKSRMGIDYTPDNRDKGFEEILRTIYNKPMYEKPPLGEPPSWVEKNNSKMNNNADFYALTDHMEGNILIRILDQKILIFAETKKSNIHLRIGQQSTSIVIDEQKYENDKESTESKAIVDSIDNLLKCGFISCFLDDYYALTEKGKELAREYFDVCELDTSLPLKDFLFEKENKNNNNNMNQDDYRIGSPTHAVLLGNNKP